MSTVINKHHINSTKILGHRGAKLEVLENSKEGFLYAHSLIKDGLAGIEFDIQLTHDGKLIVYHDEIISRFYNQQARVDQLNNDFFIKCPIIKSNQNYQILTLDKMPKLLTGYQHIELEIKTNQRTNHQRLLQILQDYLGNFPENLSLTLTSFDVHILAGLKHNSAFTSFKKGLLIEHPMPYQQLIDMALKFGCHQIGVLASLITPELIKQAHRYDLSITAWTVNNLPTAQHLLDISVDWIITDYPAKFLKKF